MDEATRLFLYPFGFLASVVFASRFAVQWLTSEYQKKSIVPSIFWYLSLGGNLLLFLHGLIQLQYHVAVIQGCNAVISWRNINLTKESSNQIKKRSVFLLLSIVLITITSFFSFQTLLFGAETAHWFRLPTTPWQKESSTIAFYWHLIGFSGMVLFSLRFWVQWWCAEQKQKSYIGASFWWMSVCGGTLMASYFYLIGDFVNMIGPSLGMIPYIRNLILLRRQSLAS